MQIKSLLLVASVIGSIVSAPITQDVDGLSTISTRFEAEKRDANADATKAVINSRFMDYENQERDAPEEPDTIHWYGYGS